MRERILNKKLSKASGVILVRGGEIIDFFPQTNVVEDNETGRSRGFGFVEMSSNQEGEKVEIKGGGVAYPKKRGGLTQRRDGFGDVKNSNQEIELNQMFKDFVMKKQAHYREIEISQKEIEKLNARSAKRQKRFEVAMRKLEGLLK
jgi:hypothetical protein